MGSFMHIGRKASSYLREPVAVANQQTSGLGLDRLQCGQTC